MSPVFLAEPSFTSLAILHFLPVFKGIIIITVTTYGHFLCLGYVLFHVYLIISLCGTITIPILDDEIEIGKLFKVSG